MTQSRQLAVAQLQKCVTVISLAASKPGHAFGFSLQHFLKLVRRLWSRPKRNISDMTLFDCLCNDLCEGFRRELATAWLVKLGATLHLRDSVIAKARSCLRQTQTLTNRSASSSTWNLQARHSVFAGNNFPHRRILDGKKPQFKTASRSYCGGGKTTLRTWWRVLL